MTVSATASGTGTGSRFFSVLAPRVRSVFLELPAALIDGRLVVGCTTGATQSGWVIDRMPAIAAMVEGQEAAVVTVTAPQQPEESAQTFRAQDPGLQTQLWRGDDVARTHRARMSRRPCARTASAGTSPGSPASTTVQAVSHLKL